MDPEELMKQLHRVEAEMPIVVMQASRAVIPDLRSFCWPGAVEVVYKWSPRNVLEAVRTHQKLRRAFAAVGH